MKGVWVEDKKILKMKKGSHKKPEYLYKIMFGRYDEILTIETTMNKDIALDVSGYTLEDLGRICMYLRANKYIVEFETIKISKEVDLDIGISEEELEKIIEQKMKEEGDG